MNFYIDSIKILNILIVIAQKSNDCFVHRTEKIIAYDCFIINAYH